MVYLIECIRDYDTVYKIGYSKHPNKRVTELETGNDGSVKLLYTFSGSHERKIERTIQRLYSHNNINREWFKLDLSEVQNFLTLCKKTEDNINLLESMKI